MSGRQKEFHPKHRTVLDSLRSHGSCFTNQYVSLFSLCKSISPLLKQVGELLLHSVHPALGFVHVGHVTLIPLSSPPHYPFAGAIERQDLVPLSLTFHSSLSNPE